MPPDWLDTSTTAGWREDGPGSHDPAGAAGISPAPDGVGRPAQTPGRRLEGGAPPKKTPRSLPSASGLRWCSSLRKDAAAKALAPLLAWLICPRHPEVSARCLPAFFIIRTA
jgi:hypothetical protein